MTDIFRQHFQKHFSERKFLYSLTYNIQSLIISLVNGLALSMWQTIDAYVQQISRN